MNSFPLCTKEEVIKYSSPNSEQQHLLEKDVERMNQVLFCCDEVLKMFDELIIPAARLLDTVETKIKDYQITHQTSNSIHSQNPLQKRFIAPAFIRKTAKPLFQSSKLQSTIDKKDPATDFPSWKFKTTENTKLKQYKPPTFIENDRIDWSGHIEYREHQKRQAEEEADTDDEMIEYGLKVASKTVRTATKAFRMEYFRLSVKRLREINRKRGR